MAFAGQLILSGFQHRTFTRAVNAESIHYKHNFENSKITNLKFQVLVIRIPIRMG